MFLHRDLLVKLALMDQLVSAVSVEQLDLLELLVHLVPLGNLDLLVFKE